MAGADYTRATRSERVAIAYFGSRGIGRVVYIVYAVAHAVFAEIASVRRIAAVAVLLSILVHGALALIIMNRLPQRSGAEEDANPA